MHLANGCLTMRFLKSFPLTHPQFVIKLLPLSLYFQNRWSEFTLFGCDMRIYRQIHMNDESKGLHCASWLKKRCHRLYKSHLPVRGSGLNFLPQAAKKSLWPTWRLRHQSSRLTGLQFHHHFNHNFHVNFDLYELFKEIFTVF